MPAAVLAGKQCGIASGAEFEHTSGGLNCFEQNRHHNSLSFGAICLVRVAAGVSSAGSGYGGVSSIASYSHAAA